MYIKTYMQLIKYNGENQVARPTKSNELRNCWSRGQRPDHNHLTTAHYHLNHYKQALSELEKVIFAGDLK